MGSGSTYNEDQGGRKIPRMLTSPPFLPEGFIGREEELKSIKDKLFGGDSLLLLVNGEGGIGKTSLASIYFHTYQNEYAHAGWVLSEKNIANALLLALAKPLAMQFEETMPASERVDHLLMAMAEFKAPCLLVIDNANEIKDLEQIYQNLRRCSNFHILLTTRITEFGQAECYKIDSLPEAEALQLFRKYYPKHRDSEDVLFQQIRASVGGNTLVIELLAKNLHQFNRLSTRYSLANLYDDLQNKGLFGLRQSQAVSTDYQSIGIMRKEKPEDIIAAMYDLSQLESEETSLLSVFAVLPAESIGFEMLKTLLNPTEKLDRSLLTLARKGWIEHNETFNTFKCSPVVQEITKKKNHKHFEECGVLVGNLIDKLHYEGGVGHFVNATYDEAAVFARYAESIVLSSIEAEEQIAILSEKIGNYHKTTGDLEKALGFFEEYTRLEKELYEAYPDNVGFKNGLAISYSKLGETQKSLGDLEKALGFYEKDLQLTKELYEAYPDNVEFKNGLAISYSKLGETQKSLGDLEKALGFFEERSRLGKELYEAYPDNVQFKNNLAISYSKLGDTQTSLGDLEKALGFFEEYTRIEKELYEAYSDNVEFKNNLAISYSKLGETQKSLGDLEKALGFFEERSRLGKELYEAYPDNVEFKNGLALSYQWLGYAYEEAKNMMKAKECYVLSKELLSQLVNSFPKYVEFNKNLDWVERKLSENE
ncbi:MAG: tetratricopeptide repeat protein [Candidatus Brocadiaceae bacterium]|nr:tetratricopeptide repeat protein [Candidatus Brocadiaceae bacterium]